MAVVQRWCLEGPENIVLPLQPQTLDLCSWSAGRAETTKENCSFLCLQLGGRPAAQWLSRHLGQSPKWWWYHSRRSKVIEDIVGQFPCSALGSRANKKLGLSRNVVVPIVVRGQEILVVNDRRKLTFAFEESAPRFESLLWFLKELRLEGNPEDHKEDKNEDQKEDSNEDVEEDLYEDNEDDDESEEGDFEELIQQSLESIRAAPGCKKAWWIGSSRRFRVINHRGVMKHFPAPGKSRIMKRPSSSASSSEKVEDIVRGQVSEALRFLQGGPVSDSAAP